MNTAAILIVDDDTDDQDLLQAAWKELEYENELVFFGTGEEVLTYLQKKKELPFLFSVMSTFPAWTALN